MKTDLKKTLDCYKASHNVFRVVNVPPLQYLMIDGHGTPGVASEYEDALAALYPLAYKLKFASKRELDQDYVVMPLEGLWWADDMASFTTRRDKSVWQWTLMIMTPDWITDDMFAAAKEKVGEGDRPASLDKVRLETLEEGTSVQTLHIGSYDDEAGILEKLHNEFIPAGGMRMTGKHHEIYLGDPRKVAPERLRTILRQPVVT